MDFCFELACKLVNAVAGAITVVDEVHGFRFFDNRDLLGFVDGTENPDGPLAVSATAIGGDEDPDFAGSCYVHVQRYLHDMADWDSLSVTEQERVIGRTKLDDIELADYKKPADSHVALNVVTDDDGNELKIVRHNMPFGEIGKGEVRHLFHRLFPGAGRHRKDVAQHVHRRPAGQHRPHSGLLHRHHRRDVLFPHRRFPR